MFLILKLLKQFLLPPAWIAAGLAAGIWLLARKKAKAGMLILCLTLAVFYLLATGPVAFLLTRSLECLIPKVDKDKFPETEAIVVLAGGALKEGPFRPRPELGGISWKRFWRGIELYRELGDNIPILYSGGSGDPLDPAPLEPGLARKYAVSLGIPEKDFWTESVSRNTYESGRMIKKIIGERCPEAITRPRIVLVTSSIHMIRSLMVMEKAGLTALPAAADFPVSRLKLDVFNFIPSAENFALSSACIHEWLGIAGYYLMNRL